MFKAFLFVLFFGVFTCFGQHNVGGASTINKFDVFTELAYHYQTYRKVHLGASFGVGVVNTFLTGVPLYRSGLTFGYKFNLGKKGSISPAFFSNLEFQQTDLVNDFQFSNHLGYVLIYGTTIKFMTSANFGFGRSFNSVVSANYVSYNLNLGVLYEL